MLLTNKVLHSLRLPERHRSKESVCQCTRCKRQGLDPWSRKIPWRRKWQFIPEFLPGNSMVRGAWKTMFHGVTKSDTTEWLSTKIVLWGSLQKKKKNGVTNHSYFCHLFCRGSYFETMKWIHLSKWSFVLVHFCCFCSIAKLCLTLCNPMDYSSPGFPVLHHLLEFAQTYVRWVDDAIQPSHPLLPPSPLAFNLSQHQGLFQWVVSLH